MNDLLGKTEEEARWYCENKNIPFRVTRIDGQYMIITMNYNPARVNVEIDNGVVTKTFMS